MTSLLCPAEVSIDALRLEEAALAGIYFIQQGDNGPIKIGWSKNVRSRLAGLQTANPYPLRLLLVLDGEERDERRLHDWFGTERLNGEWFKSDGEVGVFVAEKLAKPSKQAEPIVETARCDGRKPKEPCWGDVRRYSIDDDWFCEGHWEEREGHGYFPEPPRIHGPRRTDEMGRRCRKASSDEPCWGEIVRFGDFDDTYCEAHHPVDGPYSYIASKTADQMAERNAYADETCKRMGRFYRRLADIAGCEWAYIPGLAPSTEQIVKMIEGDSEAISALRASVFGEVAQQDGRPRVDTLLASLGGDLEG